MIAKLFYLAGGLGLFLVGMKIMSDGIQRSAGSRLRNILHAMTGHRLPSVLIGLGTTAIVQSSSATTVMVVSLVNAQLITLTGAIGVIMGANIGTTLTAWIVSLLGFKIKIASFALPAIAIGLPLHFAKKEKLRDISNIFIGFGLLFLGLSEMKDAVSAISHNTAALEFLKTLTGYGYGSLILFVLFGTLLTITVQSSSAAMAITLTLAFNGWIPYDIACAIVLGENIGTTITAFLASLEMSTNAKRAARAHMFFNLIGVLWMLLFFPLVLELIDYIVPGSPANTDLLPFHLSAFHTFFNITNTFILFWFIPLLEKLVVRLVPEKEDEELLSYKIPHVYQSISESGEINLINAQAEVAKMSNLVHKMFTKLMNSTEEAGPLLTKTVERLARWKDITDQMHEQISALLAECSTHTLSEEQAASLTSQLSIINELESIANATYKVANLLLIKEQKSLNFHKNAWGEIQGYTFKVMDFLQYNTGYLNNTLLDQSKEVAEELENKLNTERAVLNKRSRKKISKGGDLRGELLYMDIIRQLEHIGDFCYTMSQTIRESL